MKKNLFFVVSLVILLALVFGSSGLNTSAQDEGPTPEEMAAAIQAGLEWLVNQQQADGSWGNDCDGVARTGLAVLKLNTYSIENGEDPLTGTYAGEIQAGLDYIIANRHAIAIGVEPAGDPDGNGNGIGVHFTVCNSHHIYNTGIAMMALASSGDPGTYGTDLQDAVDFMAWAQADPDCGVHRGGWRYNPDECSSDNSNSGYATLGLGYAQAAPPIGFGLTVPQWLKDEHTVWIDVIQDDVNGDPDDGGSWYDPSWSWVNILKTGNLLYEMGLVGDDVTTQRVIDAVDYIERHWNDPGGCDTGWVNHRQAMFTMMKGLESLGIEYLDLDGDGTPEHDWFAEVSQHLIDTQEADGGWGYDCWGDRILSTTWALLTLEKSVPRFEIEVYIDIKPGSCPNPINTGSKGVLPVAILGTEDFDVTTIDPASIRLLANPDADPPGVAPLRWSYEDVATPYDGELVDAYSCHEMNGDGYMDLTLKFKEQEVAAALGDVSDGDVIIVMLTGTLTEENGATPIFGADVVKIIVKK